MASKLHSVRGLGFIETGSQAQAGSRAPVADWRIVVQQPRKRIVGSSPPHVRGSSPRTPRHLRCSASARSLRQWECAVSSQKREKGERALFCKPPMSLTLLSQTALAYPFTNSSLPKFHCGATPAEGDPIMITEETPAPEVASPPADVSPSDGSSSETSSEGTPSSPPTPATPPSPTFSSESVGGDFALLGFICGGPVLKKAGISKESVQENIGKWVELGGELAQQLQFDVEGLTYPQLGRIFHYYLPVYFWCMQQMESHKAEHPGTPLIVGISAPQGCGKTTVVESLEYLFKHEGVKAASVSIDDFYLTNKEQTQLAANNPGNKLLELRGNAGSHDLELAVSTLKALSSASTPDSKVSLPRYDKSAFSGRGDRAPESEWPVAEGPLDVVLLEGWMLGFTPLPSDAHAQSVDQQLVPVNTRLVEYKKLHDFVDCWVVIQVKDPDWVFQWRLEAEVRMRQTGKPGMTDEQVADFVSRYIPAYKAYLPNLYASGPPGAEPSKTLSLAVDRERNPTK